MLLGQSGLTSHDVKFVAQHGSLKVASLFVHNTQRSPLIRDWRVHLRSAQYPWVKPSKHIDPSLWWKQTYAIYLRKTVTQNEMHLHIDTWVFNAIKNLSLKAAKIGGDYLHHWQMQPIRTTCTLNSYINHWVPCSFRTSILTTPKMILLKLWKMVTLLKNKVAAPKPKIRFYLMKKYHTPVISKMITKSENW